MTPESQNTENTQETDNLQPPAATENKKSSEGNAQPAETAQQEVPHQADADTQVAAKIPDEKVLSEIDPEKASDITENQRDYDGESIENLIGKGEKLLKSENPYQHLSEIISLKDAIQKKADKETAEKKEAHLAEGNSAETFQWQHPQREQVDALNKLFKEKHEEHQKKLAEDDAKHLADREKIVERLKNLYTNAEPGTNLFKAIREIKQDWQNAGSVSKSVFKNVSNNYFFHMKKFYQMLDMNKEYLEQEFSHNLERRNQIIERAKELENEPSVQKALNELQYLHKVWKDEAGPVAEEFRESTWQAFKEISNKIHERRDQFSHEMDAAREANLEKKNKIISEIRAIATAADKTGHNFWQQSIKKVEALREEFMQAGGVPKKHSAQSWSDFKDALKEFNSAKNDFYKNLKENQSANLDKKRALIQTAKDNAASEDWETAVPLFKKLQEDWKETGHVPKNLADEIWTEFRAACNQFFENFRNKNKGDGDNWKENFKKKQELLDRLKNAAEDDQAGISAIKKEWDETGKVPREKMGINTEFSKILREKSKSSGAEFGRKRDDRYADSQPTEKARKIKNQIADLEGEISTLENNLGFFSNPSRENPLLKDTFDKIDHKKTQLEELKKSLHEAISAE